MSASVRALLIALALAGGCARAQTGPVAAPPDAEPFRIGALKAWSLHDAQFIAANDGKLFGLGQPPGAVDAVLRKAGAPTDRIALSVNVLLVKTPGHTILFDSGLGAGLHGGLMQSLALTGVKPGEITDVLITHTHGDHIGGVVAPDHTLAFPNATIRMSEAEWAWAKTQNPSLTSIMAPKVETFRPGAALFPGVTPVALTGHTPGQVGYLIVSGRDHLFDLGDVAHSSIISLAEPDWNMQFDNDKELGRTERRAELTRLAANADPVFAPHFPYPGLGRIVASGSGFVWRPDALKLPASHPR